jgi:hypothetical protein
MTHLSRSSTFWLLNRVALVGICLLVSGISIAQTTKKTTGGDEEPVFLDYRGVQIGWLADDVRKKLGVPADKGDEQDFYKFSDNETCQVLYDKATRKVTAISVDFSNGANGVITPQQVFGADIDSKPDGSKYKLVRYPKAGYWVSYYRGGGTSGIITITMQKMP